jgi:hypothetical protein
MHDENGATGTCLKSEPAAHHLNITAIRTMAHHKIYNPIRLAARHNVVGISEPTVRKKIFKTSYVFWHLGQASHVAENTPVRVTLENFLKPTV